MHDDRPTIFRTPSAIESTPVACMVRRHLSPDFPDESLVLRAEHRAPDMLPDLFLRLTEGNLPCGHNELLLDLAGGCTCASCHTHVAQVSDMRDEIGRLAASRRLVPA